MTTTQPHNPTTTARPVRVGGDDYDPFATIPGAYDDYTPPATKPAVQTPPAAQQPRWREHSNSGVNHLVGPTRVNSECGNAEAQPSNPSGQPFVHTWNAPSADPLMRCTRCVALDTPPPAAPVQVVTRTRVVDCPSYAWDNSDQAAYQEIGAAFYSLHRPELDAAAHELIRPPLIAEWRKAGRLARLVPQGTFTSVPDSAEEYVPDEQRWAVWQAAADQIAGAELVFAAGLVDEYRAFSGRDY